MKKTVIIISIVAVAAMLAAVILGSVLGGGTAQMETPGTSGSTGGTTGGTSKPIIKCEHVYEDNFCTACGAEKPTGDEFFAFRLLDDGTYSISATLITELPERLVIPEEYDGKPVSVIKRKGFIGAKNLKYVYIP
jgi:hypothetical protein